jgi:arylsulfatase
MADAEQPTLEPGFGGRTARTVDGSSPSWPPRRGRRGPNVVIVLLDDVGFAQLGCYGSSISTPNIDALAQAGLLYTNFHVPALCSPTRASLLTGRNHHAVGVGFLAAFDTGFPGYRGAISPAAATLPEMLRGAGYASYMTGKWHLTPPADMSPAGPFDHWPTQRGFDRYYGFLWGEDDQFSPEVWYDQHRVETPRSPDYHFSVDMVARAKEFIADHLTSRPDDPFLAYLAFGAGHAPHQAPAAFIRRYAGRFDHGWDEERRRILERQIDRGVVPPDTQLAERNPGVPEWAGLSADEQRLYARLQEAFAGFMEHADEQIGRLVGFLRAHDVLDDTVIMVLSDNGASGEGGRDGTINEYRYFLGLSDSVDDALAAIDEIGGPLTHNQYPAGWAQAGNTPLRYYKKFAHGGGVRAPLVIHWPAGLGPSRGVRTQFHHVIDVLPTILDIARLEPPTVHQGTRQLPIDGVSMRYTFDHAEAVGTRPRQYFETAGNRAIYDQGWKAVSAHEPGTSFDGDRWEVFDLRTDFAESRDLAAERPEEAQRLEQLWWEEAERYCVLPLDDRMGSRVAALDPAMDRPRYVLLPGTRLLNHVVGPSFSARPFVISSRVHCAAGDEGVLLAYGRRAFGFSWFVKEGRLWADFNFAGKHTLLVSESVMPDREAELQLAVAEGRAGARARLLVDGSTVASAALPQLIPGGIGTLSIQCGHNSPSPVSDEYDAPFTFSGTLERVVVDLGPRIHPTRQTVEEELAFE